MQMRARLSNDHGWRQNRHDHHKGRARILTSGRVSPQLNAHSPRLCRRPGGQPQSQRGENGRYHLAQRLGVVPVTRDHHDEVVAVSDEPPIAETMFSALAPLPVTDLR
jgi:hypothetical protein